jgi:L-threonylcarbamoyladenylate synthase
MNSAACAEAGNGPPSATAGGRETRAATRTGARQPGGGSERRPESVPGFDAAVAALKRGGVVVYPTETLYALGVRSDDDAAVDRLVSLKGREPGKPIAVIIGDVDLLKTVATEVTPQAQALMRKFWPGPLTIVLRARAGLSSPLVGGDGGIGVRLSSDPVARALSRAVGAPLTAPSANPAGQPPPRTVAEARAYFETRVDAYVDGGVLAGEPPSTVVDARNKVVTLRPGVISAASLQAAVKESPQC